MAKMYAFKAMGRGHFPHDMLRYDQCWPRSSEDAVKAAYDQMQMGREDWSKTREIELASHRKPTPERWLSFGWPIGAAKEI